MGTISTHPLAVARGKERSGAMAKSRGELGAIASFAKGSFTREFFHESVSRVVSSFADRSESSVASSERGRRSWLSGDVSNTGRPS